ncbi:hypothetical protein C3492_07795 [Streptomyces sp. Ru62]|nr:hypothetical protein C3492_07795 [Streptomyces sp. Ru62]
MARILLAVALVVLLSHLFGLLVGRLGQEPVIGEILGGLLLGPSAPGTARTTGVVTATDASRSAPPGAAIGPAHVAAFVQASGPPQRGKNPWCPTPPDPVRATGRPAPRPVPPRGACSPFRSAVTPGAACCTPWWCRSSPGSSSCSSSS